MPDHRKIIAFNGPKGCGKDTASEAVRSFVQIHAAWMHPTHMKLAEVLKKGAHALYSAFHGWDYYDSEGRREKDAACGDFFGMSPREAYIKMFEYLRDTHGPQALGWLLRKRVVRNSHANVIVCSDLGRIEDMEPLIDLVGQHNFLIVEIHPEGLEVDFNDNRSYCGDEIKAKYPGVQVMKLPNRIGARSDREIFRMLCQGVAKKFLDIEEKETA